MASIAIILPILMVDLLPFVDYPLHLSLIGILRDLDDPAASAVQYHVRWFTPYSGMYWIAALMVSAVPIETIGKLLLILYMVFTPPAFMVFLRATGQNPRYGLLMYPLLYNFNLSWGFLPFLISMPLVFLTLSVTVAVALRNSKPATAVLPVLLIFLFFMHLFAFLVTLFLVAVIILSGTGTFRQKLWLLVWFGAAPVLVNWIWYRGLSYSVADQVFLSKKLVIPPVLSKLAFLPEYILSGDPFRGYGVVLGSMAGIMILYCMLDRLRSERLKSAGFPAGLRIRWIVPAAVLGAYLACPYSLLTAVWLFNRLAFLVPATLILVLPANPPRRMIADCLLILIIAGFGLYTVRLYLLFEREAVEGLACLERIEPGKRLEGCFIDSRSRYTDHTVYDHFDQYYQIRYEGVVHNPFAVLTHMPIRYTDPHFKREAGVTGCRGNPPGWRLPRFREIDYFFLRQYPEKGSNPIPYLFGDNLFDVRQAVVSGPWSIYQKKDPAMETGP